MRREEQTLREKREHGAPPSRSRSATTKRKFCLQNKLFSCVLTSCKYNAFCLFLRVGGIFMLTPASEDYPLVNYTWGDSKDIFSGLS